jgi:hypothetical protein
MWEFKEIYDGYIKKQYAVRIVDGQVSIQTPVNSVWFTDSEREDILAENYLTDLTHNA